MNYSSLLPGAAGWGLEHVATKHMLEPGHCGQAPGWIYSLVTGISPGPGQDLVLMLHQAAALQSSSTHDTATRLQRALFAGRVPSQWVRDGC